MITIKIPKIEECSLIPDITETGGKIILTAKVSEIEKILYPDEYFSGEFQSGEI